MDDRVRTMWPGAMLLGEGPVWDARTEMLWFVDIKACRVHRLDPATGRVDTWDAPAAIGWVLPAVDDGMLIAGLQTGLACFDSTKGRFEHLAAVEPQLTGNRLNDATVGTDGEIWFGSMDDAEERASGRVYRFDGRGVTATTIAPCVITNGPAMSLDGRTLYHVDSPGRTIYAIPVADDGTTGTARVFVRIDAADGYPDGVSVDSLGNLWVGLWQGWCARLYGPDGALLREVRLPVANVTKVALGGHDMRTAYATTARIGLDAAALAAQPEAGNLFGFDVEVPGRTLPLARLR